MVCSTYKYIPHINSIDNDDLYCHAVECIDQGLHTELVYSTYKYIPHINIVDDNDLYCCAIECIDQGLHTELVCNSV